MYIYSICMSYEVDDDVCFEYEYVVSEIYFTKEEFDKICKDCLKECKDKCNYELKSKLRYYGFKPLKVVSNFDFNEEIK